MSGNKSNLFDQSLIRRDKRLSLIFQPGHYGQSIVVRTFARVERLQGRGLAANSRVDWFRTQCAETRQLRKSHAMKHAPPLFNRSALPTKTIYAAREMEPVRKCRDPVRQIATARVPSFVALNTVIGLMVSTAARNHMQWTACGRNGLGQLAANHVKMVYVMEHG